MTDIATYNWYSFCKRRLYAKGNLWSNLALLDIPPNKRAEGGDTVDMKQVFKEGQLIIYHNGDKYEIGKIKSFTRDGAFVYYSSGETAAKTPFDLMHPLVNEYCIGETSLGGSMN